VSVALLVDDEAPGGSDERRCGVAILKRARVAGALGLVALAWLGCDLGLDPSMVGETASSGTTSSSSGGGAGGEATSTTSSSSGGVGVARAAGRAARVARRRGRRGWRVRARALRADRRFRHVREQRSARRLDHRRQINGVNVNGNRMVRAEANNAEDATMVREQSSALDACYLSVRVDPQSNPDVTYLSLACGSADVRFLVDQPAQMASVVFANPPVAPPALSVVQTPPLGGAFNPSIFTMRVRFTDQVIFEIRPVGASDYTTTHSFARPSWMQDCFVGFGITDGTQCRFDDFCVDAP
jgi:hypothetical protein